MVSNDLLFSSERNKSLTLATIDFQKKQKQNSFRSFIYFLKNMCERKNKKQIKNAMIKVKQ